MIVCCEVNDSADLSNGVNIYTIPVGKYAKVVVQGDVEQVVSEFWSKLWLMDLDRKYSCDFEEYKSECEMSNAETNFSNHLGDYFDTLGGF